MKLVVFILTNLFLTLAASAHGISDADKQGILEGGNFEYLKLGATHMLSGYDHLLFLFGVMFFLTRFRDIVKFITAFTLGHCVTLVFATLLHIKANFFLVDSVIALTVCYKAFDNLDGFKKYIGIQSPNLLGAVFLFGLIHGFGLSTRLQQLPLGQEGLVVRILSFNVGVEVGQILALTGMWFVLAGWRKTGSFLKFSKAANAVLMFAGVLLLLMQLHGYQHMRFTDEFPLNKDEHFEIHQNMERNRAGPTLKRAVSAASKNVRQFSLKSLRKDWHFQNAQGAMVGEKFDPLSRVGIYIPGGHAPLISTALMTLTLAKVAGCSEIVVCTPATRLDRSIPLFSSPYASLARAINCPRAGRPCLQWSHCGSISTSHQRGEIHSTSIKGFHQAHCNPRRCRRVGSPSAIRCRARCRTNIEQSSDKYFPHQN